jgi:hypothetical protein
MILFGGKSVQLAAGSTALCVVGRSADGKVVNNERMLFIGYEKRGIIVFKPETGARSTITPEYYGITLDELIKRARAQWHEVRLEDDLLYTVSRMRGTYFYVFSSPLFKASDGRTVTGDMGWFIDPDYDLVHGNGSADALLETVHEEKV